jgi:hypothetical protein
MEKALAPAGEVLMRICFAHAAVAKPQNVSTVACNYGNSSLTPDWAPDQAPPFGAFLTRVNFLPFC